jgi:hypothetical protein
MDVHEFGLFAAGVGLRGLDEGEEVGGMIPARVS